MIVKHTTDGWELIAQADHGRLAAAIAEQFDDLNELAYREQTLMAIAQHDDHKLQMDSGGTAYVTSFGTPKDFTFVAMDDPVREIEVSRRLQASYRQHAWVGLLAGRHAEHLYRGQAITASLQKILDFELANRDMRLADLKCSTDELEQVYDMMRFCDRCSLILCQNEVPEMGRELEITTMTDGTKYCISKTIGRTLHVDPWPFAKEAFSVCIPTRLLRQATFKDDAELAMRLESTAIHRRSFHIRATSDNSPIRRISDCSLQATSTSQE